MIYMQIGYEAIEINDFLLVPDDNFFSNYNTYKSFKCNLDDIYDNINVLRDNSNKTINITIFQSNSYYVYEFNNCYIMRYNVVFSVNEPRKVNLIVGFSSYVEREDKNRIRLLKLKKLFEN